MPRSIFESHERRWWQRLVTVALPLLSVSCSPQHPSVLRNEDVAVLFVGPTERDLRRLVLRAQVDVSSTGALAWDGEPISLSQLDERVSSAAERDVVLRIGTVRETRYRDVMPVMASISRHHLANVEIQFVTNSRNWIVDAILWSSFGLPDNL